MKICHRQQQRELVEVEKNCSPQVVELIQADSYTADA